MRIKEWIYKKRFVIVLFVSIVLICISDEQNQKQYSDVRDAFAMIEEGKHKEALKIIEQYKKGHSQVYFFLQDIVNGQDSIYSIKSVERAMEKCRENIY